MIAISLITISLIGLIVATVCFTYAVFLLAQELYQSWFEEEEE